MKIGITGGSGFIGRYFIESLERENKIDLIKIIDIEKPSFSGAIRILPWGYSGK